VTAVDLRQVHSLIDAAVERGARIVWHQGRVKVTGLSGDDPLLVALRECKAEVAFVTRPPLAPCVVCGDPRGVQYLDRGLMPLCRRHVPWGPS
jgi:hypothetical protein